MDSVLWTPKFAAVYFLAAMAGVVLFVSIGANMAAVTPLILALVGLGVAVLIRNKNKTARR